jgi:hypothetical protein
MPCKVPWLPVEIRMHIIRLGMNISKGDARSLASLRFAYARLPRNTWPELRHTLYAVQKHHGVYTLDMLHPFLRSVCMTHQWPAIQNRMVVRSQTPHWEMWTLIRCAVVSMIGKTVCLLQCQRDRVLPLTVLAFEIPQCIFRSATPPTFHLKYNARLDPTELEWQNGH